MNTLLKTSAFIFIFGLLLMAFSSCGYVEKTFEEANYETLVNKTGTIHLYSGGTRIATYEDVTITYTNSDSQAIFYETKDGDERYWQGELDMDLN